MPSPPSPASPTSTIARSVGGPAAKASAVRSDGQNHEIEEFSLETVVVPEDSPYAGRKLIELDTIRQLGVQVGGIQRGLRRILTPTGTDTIEANDELLVLGTPLQIRQFEEWLKPESTSDTPVAA